MTEQSKSDFKKQKELVTRGKATFLKKRIKNKRLTANQDSLPEKILLQR